MKNNKIPKYYTDKSLTDEQKLALDWEMIGADFPIIIDNEPEV